MLFKRIEPDTPLKEIIECYWIAEDDGTLPRKEKIVPDGFTEIIFHYGDAYRICLGDSWQRQPRGLLAGQLSRHFFLENTGTSGIIGIKMRPTALANLYNLSMQPLTDAVVEISSVLGWEMVKISEVLQSSLVNHDEKISLLNHYFATISNREPHRISPADRAVDSILERRGMVAVKELCEIASVGERQLENLFRNRVGLSPKFYARIIRFNYIFHLIQQNKKTWSDVAYEAAFYDQSHFIRNFRDFTGENPADYAFEEKNLANFFLKKTA